jgi:hypothetical protein
MKWTITADLQCMADIMQSLGRHLEYCQKQVNEPYADTTYWIRRISEVETSLAQVNTAPWSIDDEKRS